MSVDVAAIDIAMMGRALESARRTLVSRDDVIPVGAVLVCDGVEVAHGRRGRGRMDHAEMVVMETVFGYANAYDKSKEATLYTTLEPCSMCWGAMHNTPVRRVVYALRDPYGGCTRCSYGDVPRHAGRQIEVVGGVMEREAAEIMATFLRRTEIAFWRGEGGRPLKDEVARLTGGERGGGTAANSEDRPERSVE